MSIHIEKQGAVTTIIIDRPAVRNAVDGPTAHALHQAFVDFDADANASVAVLCGANDTFCAGADLKAFATTDRNPLDADMQTVAPMGPTRLVLSKPVIAAINGYAVAGGMELALWCDLRVMEEAATMGVFCRRWGVPLIDGGTVRLPRLIGQGRALDLILTGRAVDAAEALAIGLVNRVVLAGHARMAAQTLAAQLAALPQACLRSDRRSVFEQQGASLAAALTREFALGMSTITSGESGAGALRFAHGARRSGASDPAG
jgi:enoyl-CoA hydratase